MINKEDASKLIKSKIEAFLIKSGEFGTLNESSEFSSKKFSKEELAKLILSLLERKSEDYYKGGLFVNTISSFYNLIKIPDIRKDNDGNRINHETISDNEIRKEFVSVVIDLLYKANKKDIKAVCKDIFEEKNIIKQDIIYSILSSFEKKERLVFIKSQIGAVLGLSGEFYDPKIENAQIIKDFDKNDLKKFFKYLAILNTIDDNSLFISTRECFKDLKKLGAVVNDREKYNIKASEIRGEFLDVVFEILGDDNLSKFARERDAITAVKDQLKKLIIEENNKEDCHHEKITNNLSKYNLSKCIILLDLMRSLHLIYVTYNLIKCEDLETRIDIFLNAIIPYFSNKILTHILDKIPTDILDKISTLSTLMKYEYDALNNFEIPDFPLDKKKEPNNKEAPKFTDKYNGAFSDLGYEGLEPSNTTEITEINDENTKKMTEEEYHEKFSYGF